MNLPSSSIHQGRTRIKKSRTARRSTKSRKSFAASRRAILTVIILSAMVVILALLFNIFTTPERIVTEKIKNIAADYYENYLYDAISNSSIINSDHITKTIEEIIGNYAKNGFDDITLHQLLLFDNQRHANAASTLTRYCDEYETFIHYYPTEPYGKTDYRADIKYSCIFE